MFRRSLLRTQSNELPMHISMEFLLRIARIRFVSRKIAGTEYFRRNLANRIASAERSMVSSTSGNESHDARCAIQLWPDIKVKRNFIYIKIYCNIGRVCLETLDIETRIRDFPSIRYRLRFSKNACAEQLALETETRRRILRENINERSELAIKSSR